MQNIYVRLHIKYSQMGDDNSKIVYKVNKTSITRSEQVKILCVFVTYPLCRGPPTPLSFARNDVIFKDDN